MTTSKPTRVEQLIAGARALIAKPEDWTKGKYFTYRFGDEGVTYCQRCMVGAIRDESRRGVYSATTYLSALKALFRHLPKTFKAAEPLDPTNRLIAYNDAPKTKHHLILKVFDDTLKDLAAGR